MKFEPCFSLRARRKQSRSSCDRHLPETKCLKTSLALWEAHSEDAFSRIFALCDSIGYHRILALGRMIPRTLKLILTQDVGNTRMLGSHISSQGQTLLSKFSFSELLQLRFLHWNSMLYGSWSRKEKYILFQNIFSAVLHAQMSLDQCSLFPPHSCAPHMRSAPWRQRDLWTVQWIYIENCLLRSPWFEYLHHLHMFFCDMTHRLFHLEGLLFGVAGRHPAITHRIDTFGFFQLW